MSEPDLSEFEALSKPQQNECWFVRALEQLGKRSGAADQLKAAIDTDKGQISHVAIASWLKNKGFKITAQAVARHRSGACSCG